MTTEAEHEAAVQRAVTEAVEALESPDRHRLALLERRLLAGSRRPHRPWRWLVAGAGLLTAGALAAYWAMPEPETDDAPAPVVEEPGSAAGESTGGAASEAGANGEDGRPERQEGSKDRVIYIGQ